MKSVLDFKKIRGGTSPLTLQAPQLRLDYICEAKSRCKAAGQAFPPPFFPYDPKGGWGDEVAVMLGRNLG